MCRKGEGEEDIPVQQKPFKRQDLPTIVTIVTLHYNYRRKICGGLI